MTAIPVPAPAPSREDINYLLLTIPPGAGYFDLRDRLGVLKNPYLAGGVGIDNAIVVANAAANILYQNQWTAYCFGAVAPWMVANATGQPYKAILGPFAGQTFNPPPTEPAD